MTLVIGFVVSSHKSRVPGLSRFLEGVAEMVDCCSVCQFPVPPSTMILSADVVCPILLQRQIGMFERGKEKNEAIERDVGTIDWAVHWE